MFSTASGTDQIWLASIMSSRSGPMMSRMIPARRTSSATSGEPTFILTAVQPSATAVSVRALTFSSG